MAVSNHGWIWIKAFLSRAVYPPSCMWIWMIQMNIQWVSGFTRLEYYFPFLQVQKFLCRLLHCESGINIPAWIDIWTDVWTVAGFRDVEGYDACPFPVHGSDQTSMDILLSILVLFSIEKKTCWLCELSWSLLLSDHPTEEYPSERGGQCLEVLRLSELYRSEFCILMG